MCHHFPGRCCLSKGLNLQKLDNIILRGPYTVHLILGFLKQKGFWRGPWRGLGGVFKGVFKGVLEGVLNGVLKGSWKGI